MTNQSDKNEKKEAIEEKLERITEAKVAEEVATRQDKDTILIHEEKYHIEKDYNEAFDIEKFNERFSDILEKYDYIVGDMSYDMLRLRGFYEDSVRKAPIDMRISSLEDYLLEYCSFGCGYFVLKRESARKQQTKDSYSNKETAHKKEPAVKKESAQRKEPVHKKEATQKRGAKSSKNTTQRPVKKETQGPKDKKETTHSDKKPQTRKEFTKKDISKRPEQTTPAPKAEKVKTVTDKQGKKKFEIRRKNSERKD